MRVHFGTCQNGPIATEVPDGRDTRKQARRYRASLRTPWHDSVGCLSSRLTELLSKANTYSGKALESAKRIFKGKVRQDAIRDTLPDAWNKIVGEPDLCSLNFLLKPRKGCAGSSPMRRRRLSSSGSIRIFSYSRYVAWDLAEMASRLQLSLSRVIKKSRIISKNIEICSRTQ